MDYKHEGRNCTETFKGAQVLFVERNIIALLLCEIILSVENIVFVICLFEIVIGQHVVNI